MNAIFVFLISLFVLTSCTQSGRRQPKSNSDISSTRNTSDSPKKWAGKTIVQIERKDGVNYIPIEINGIKMFFIFDTGAGMVSISGTEALFLYKQGTLSDDDILGTANFIDANGNITEGTIINLKTVKVGNRTLNNIKASVVHNMKAPLLLGQSVLEEFGTITIDNNKSVIIFE
jgi:aspartyl protease family protein